MNQNFSRVWKVLSWNVRGINSPSKWNTIKDKVFDSACDVVCFQETKKEVRDLAFYKKMSAHPGLTVLSFYLLWVHQGDYWWLGKVLSSGVAKFFTMITLSRWNFFPNMTTVPGS